MPPRSCFLQAWPQKGAICSVFRAAGLLHACFAAPLVVFLVQGTVGRGDIHGLHCKLQDHIPARSCMADILVLERTVYKTMKLMRMLLGSC